MHFYLHAGRIPEGYRKVNRSVNRFINRPVNRPVDRPVNRPGLETRPAGRILEGFQTILVICSPGPASSCVKLRIVDFTCTPEGYQKNTARVAGVELSSVKALTESDCNSTRTPEG